MARQECNSHSIECYELESASIIEMLVAVNPKALVHVETSTGLYPFLLAASDNTTAGLDIIFSLLSQTNPAVLETKASAAGALCLQERSSTYSSETISNSCQDT